jgi:hypothetical protein
MVHHPRPIGRLLLVTAAIISVGCSTGGAGVPRPDGDPPADASDGPESDTIVSDATVIDATDDGALVDAADDDRTVEDAWLSVDAAPTRDAAPGSCHGLENIAPEIVVEAASGPIPTGVSGVLSPGVYVKTRVRSYAAADAGSVGLRQQTTLLLDPPRFWIVTRNEIRSGGFQEQRIIGRIDQDAGSPIFPITCPSGYPNTAWTGYAASPEKIVFHAREETYEYERR